ncbi:hypothetical protein B0E52_09135 [Rhodanobacter sp. C06]|uniref:hypothetical protein n=1 Tax=Rhodanobacter sp. C06 TaxID=1945854 RepID=UPI0009867082|nr:hypothetical protein [Rhodanobacter sp. C06]OOG43112.1 hypothetical protein B0E52_09135 [Rhodanobacter sp. C06]
MTRFSTLLTRAAAVLVLGSVFLLGGCHMFGGGTKGTVSTAQMKGKFDTTIQAYKEGQFVIDGAVLSAVDAGSHFAYLKDTGKLPKTVLLLPSDDSKIRKVHLQYLARMSIDYGFTAYYDNGGQLTEINAINTKARQLEDHHAPVKIDDGQQCKTAAGCDSVDQAAQQQR